MPLRWGPGPVFAYESLAATRRWRSFANRSLFVFGLLVALALTVVVATDGTPLDRFTVKQIASLGEWFYHTVASVQITMVLLLAPIATADSICLERTRGNLVQLFATHLSNSEIVLGKLAARLIPVFALVGATVPVLVLVGLLGGVSFAAVVTLSAITVALVVFVCSLALAFSVGSQRTHDVLTAVYAIEAVWILGPLVWSCLHGQTLIPGVPSWYFDINPYVLAWSPYAGGSTGGTAHLLAFLGGGMALAAGLVSYAILRVRAEERNRLGAPAGRMSSCISRVGRRVSGWLPRPSLDENPVLWREQHGGRVSRLARIVWGLYFALALAGTAWGIAGTYHDPRHGSTFLRLVNAFQATFGLLLVSLAAPAVMAERRVRGGFDVLLATPLSTARIVAAKWWTAYRVVLAVAFLPAIGAVCIAATDPGAAPIPKIRAPAHLGAIDRIALVGLPVGLLLAQGAVVTSIGLALATWMRRLGRAVAVSVAGYAIFAFGWVAVVEFDIPDSIMGAIGLTGPNDALSEFLIEQTSMSVCPFGAQYLAWEGVPGPTAEERACCYLALILLLIATLALAALVRALTLATFDRSVGRMPERPRRVPVLSTPRLRPHSARPRLSWRRRRTLQMIGQRGSALGLRADERGDLVGVPVDRVETLAREISRHQDGRERIPHSDGVTDLDRDSGMIGPRPAREQ